MDGRTAIITGASSGLGLECTRDVLRRDEGWHVVLAVRDRGRGEAAAAALDAPRRCTVMVLDLASLASVRGFVAALPGKGLPRLHAVVCNAAVQVVTGTRWSADGIELTFATNHLGHFALVNGILDQLEAPARIAVVSSDTHDPSKGPGMPAPRYQTAAALAHPGEEPGPQPRSVAAATRPPSCATSSSPMSSTGALGMVGVASRSTPSTRASCPAAPPTSRATTHRCSVWPGATCCR
jgi:NAD(P)-dependent dehydrogenase (short-subunit alcohol dehydrogenase family)